MKLDPKLLRSEKLKITLKKVLTVGLQKFNDTT